jgi:hypothetical protein
MIAILLAGCSTFDLLESSPFTDEDCNYSLEEANTGEERCHPTRPYYQFGSIYTHEAEEYTTFDLVISAAPEGCVGMRQFALAFNATPEWDLEDLLSVEYPTGEIHSVDVDERDQDRSVIEIGGNERDEPDSDDVAIPSLEPGETAVFTLVFDRAGLDTEEIEYLILIYDNEQTWYGEDGVEQTTRFRDHAPEQTSESIGLSF